VTVVWSLLGALVSLLANDHTAFRLLQSRFHWVQDYPFNR